MEKSPEDRLQALLADMDPQRIWRPVLAPDGRILAPGAGLMEDGPQAMPDWLDFSGKTVVDLGCNFGGAVFWALERGALRADGVDSDSGAVQGARLLAQWRGVKNATFHVSDFLDSPLPVRADMALLIDFIGKATIVKLRLDAALTAARSAARREILATVRPVYKARDLCGASEEALSRAYGREFVREGSFYLAEYMGNYFSPDWEMSVLAKQGRLDKKYKYAILFTRKS